MVKAKKEIGDQMKAVDGPNTICLHISSEALQNKHFEQNREQIQLHKRVNDAAQYVMIWWR